MYKYISFVIIVFFLPAACTMVDFTSRPGAAAKKINNTRIYKDYITIGVIGDTQSRTAADRRLYDRAAKGFRKHKVHMVFHLGDQQWNAGKREYRSFKRRTKRLLGNIKFYPILGNHDLSTLKYGYWINPKLKWKWCKVWGSKNSYYYFDYFGYRFIVIDTSLTFVSERQNKWLEKVLKGVRNKKTFIFMHRPPPIPVNSAVYYKGRNWHSYWDMDPIPYWGKTNKRLFKVLYRNRHKIAALFTGHYHAFRSTSFYGTKMFVSGGAGGPLEKKSAYHHYLIMKVYKNRFIVDVKKL